MSFSLDLFIIKLYFKVKHLVHFRYIYKYLKYINEMSSSIPASVSQTVDNLIESSTGLLSIDSVIESFLSLKPMFDLKPINLHSNITFNKKYTHIFGFESLFESHEFVNKLGEWMRDNWHKSFLYSLIYIMFIFLGQMFMRSRERYELRLPLILWNLGLAIFSVTGAIRVWPEFLYAVKEKGIVYSVCDNSYAYGITGFWVYMFIMSKLPELVDTIFIVFRKQKLIFLHWYHHATVLIYCWYSYSDFSATGRWFMTMNYFVHGLMYSYYACKAMRLPVPLFISKIITTSQIVQMILGCYVNWIAYETKMYQPETQCNISYQNIYSSFVMYLSYFALFFNFFLNVYVFSSKSKSSGRLSPSLTPAKAESESNGKQSHGGKLESLCKTVHDSSSKKAKKIN